MDFSEQLPMNSYQIDQYDHSKLCAYFLTICISKRACYFGNIVDGIMISFPLNEIIRDIWEGIPDKFSNVDLDAFIIMPNHVHGIIIVNRGLKESIYNDNCVKEVNRHAVKDYTLMKDSKLIVVKIIRYFKTKSTRLIHRSGFPHFKWQRNYYVFGVPTKSKLEAVREHIINNPVKWNLDRDNYLSKNFNMDPDKYYMEVFEK